jgi:AraC-like DNA-binding protein
MERIEIKRFLSNIDLDIYDIAKIKNDISKKNWHYIKVYNKTITGIEQITNLIEELYVLRYKLNLSIGDISNYYGKEESSIQKMFKELGWNRNRYEAQAITTTKRNYTEIRAKSKQTLLNMSANNEA